jgi:hypothetical protein
MAASGATVATSVSASASIPPSCSLTSSETGNGFITTGAALCSADDGHFVSAAAAADAELSFFGDGFSGTVRAIAAAEADALIPLGTASSNAAASVVSDLFFYPDDTAMEVEISLYAFGAGDYGETGLLLNGVEYLGMGTSGRFPFTPLAANTFHAFTSSTASRDASQPALVQNLSELIFTFTFFRPGGSVSVSPFEAVPIPEPGTIEFAAIALLCLWTVRRNRVPRKQ